MSQKSNNTVNSPQSFDDFEEWEYHFELLESKNYPALVKYCRQEAEKYPNDFNVQCSLAEAYNLNEEYEKTIEFLSSYHKKDPSYISFQHEILDALFALGKNENDFDWIEEPQILKISKEVMDTCYQLLKSKKTSLSTLDLYAEFLMDDESYLFFTEEDLKKALIADKGFVVDNDTDGIFAEVRVAYVT